MKSIPNWTLPIGPPTDCPNASPHNTTPSGRCSSQRRRSQKAQSVSTLSPGTRKVLLLQPPLTGASGRSGSLGVIPAHKESQSHSGSLGLTQRHAGSPTVTYGHSGSLRVTRGHSGRESGQHRNNKLRLDQWRVAEAQRGAGNGHDITFSNNRHNPDVMPD